MLSGISLRSLINYVFVTALASCNWAPPSCVDSHQPPSHPTLYIVDSSIRPEGIIHIGETLHVTAITSELSAEYTPIVILPSSKGIYEREVIPLCNDGSSKDDVACDCIWHANFVWDDKYAVGEEVYIFITIDFKEDYFFDHSADIYKLEVISN